MLSRESGLLVGLDFIGETAYPSGMLEQASDSMVLDAY